MGNKKLSIITINYNNAEGLRKTMESVFAQTCKEFEYIVVDGASTDGSVDVIRASALQVEGLTFTWVSEKDTGIYNAMNKGIEIALGRRIVNSFNRSEFVEDKNKGIEIASGLRVVNALNRSERSEDKNKGVEIALGKRVVDTFNRSERSECENKELPEYVLMLNSGDYLVDEHVIERILPALHTEDMIQGNLLKDYRGKVVQDRGYGRSELSFLDVMDANFLHQATFIKLSTMEQYGYYDESYKKGSDTYFFITALGLGNATYRYVDIDVANFDMNGITHNPKWQQIDKEEDARWYGEHISKRLWDLYQSAPKKIQLYDQLHKHKFIWKLTMVLAQLAKRL